MTASTKMEGLGAKESERGLEEAGRKRVEMYGMAEAVVMMRRVRTCALAMMA